jgi:hypothetical protein
VPYATIQRHAKSNGWTRPRGAEPEARMPPHLVKAQLTHRVNAAERRELLRSRLWAIVERHVAEVETRAETPGVDIMEREREARFTGVVVRIARDLENLDSNAEKAARALKEQSPAGEVPARSLDDIRQDFARRVEDLFGNRDPSAGAE